MQDRDAVAGGGHAKQLLHGGTHPIRVDQLADPGLAGLAQQDEADAGRGPLLVALQRVEDRLQQRRVAALDPGRQPVAGEDRLDLLAQRRRLGEPQRRQQAEPDRLAVAVALVRGRRLDPVADRVAEVEHLAQAAVALVGGDDLALEAGAGEDDVGQLDRVELFDQPHPLPQRAAGQQPGLQRLDEAGAPARPAAASPGCRCRRRPPPAAGRRRRSSCPPAGRRRSCRRRRSRPGRPAWSAPGRPARRAGRGGRRSRRGRRRRRRRGRRGGRRGSSPARASSRSTRSASAIVFAASPGGTATVAASGCQPLGVERADRLVGDAEAAAAEGPTGPSRQRAVDRRVARRRPGRAARGRRRSGTRRRRSPPRAASSRPAARPAPGSPAAPARRSAVAHRDHGVGELFVERQPLGQQVADVLARSRPAAAWCGRCGASTRPRRPAARRRRGARGAARIRSSRMLPPPSAIAPPSAPSSSAPTTSDSRSRKAASPCRSNAAVDRQPERGFHQVVDLGRLQAGGARGRQRRALARPHEAR